MIIYMKIAEEIRRRVREGRQSEKSGVVAGKRKIKIKNNFCDFLGISTNIFSIFIFNKSGAKCIFECVFIF